jgi:hypothetical protein
MDTVRYLDWGSNSNAGLPLIVLVLPFRDATFVVSAMIRQRQGPGCLEDDTAIRWPATLNCLLHPVVLAQAFAGHRAIHALGLIHRRASRLDRCPTPARLHSHPPFPPVSISTPRFVGSFPTFERPHGCAPRSTTIGACTHCQPRTFCDFSSCTILFFFCLFPAVFYTLRDIDTLVHTISISEALWCCSAALPLCCCAAVRPPPSRKVLDPSSVCLCPAQRTKPGNRRRNCCAPRAAATTIDLFSLACGLSQPSHKPCSVPERTRTSRFRLRLFTLAGDFFPFIPASTPICAARFAPLPYPATFSLARQTTRRTPRTGPRHHNRESHCCRPLSQ